MLDSDCDDYDEDNVLKMEADISDLYISIQGLVESNWPTLSIHSDSNTGECGPSNQATGAQVSNSSSTVRLPKINLPTFNGTLNQWPQFKDLFLALIHTNTSLKPIEKLHYLISATAGEAQQLTRSLPLCDNNYELVWQQLLERYDNRRLLANHYLDEIMHLKAVTSESPKLLRNMLDILVENTNALKAMQMPDDLGDFIILNHSLKKLDSHSRQLFERKFASVEFPKLEDFLSFFKEHCKCLEAACLNSIPTSSFTLPSKPTSTIPTSKQFNKSYGNLGTKPNKSVLMSVSDNKQSQTCDYCKATHKTFQCDKFKALTSQQRYSFIKEKGLCVNCLGSHKTYSCKSLHSCRECTKRHHTLLHFNKQEQVIQPDTSLADSLPSSSLQSFSKPADKIESGDTLVAATCTQGNMVLLATALVSISTEKGHQIVARAVLDSASQVTIISEHCASLLQVSRSSTGIPEITGISSAQVKPKGLTHVHFSSLSGVNFAKSHSVLILDKISNYMPRIQLSPDVRIQLKGYKLADPHFDIPGPIDILIGADLFTQTLVGPTISLGENMPHAINTIFGYVIIGTAPVMPSFSPYSGLSTLFCGNELDLHSTLQRFWSIEEPPHCSRLSPQEEECERHFLDTHSRDSTGRFVCRLPFKDDPKKLGESSNAAKSTFLSMERKFESNPQLKHNYIGFMNEYFTAGHMKLCSDTSEISKPRYFLPHHSVHKDGKIRVVFNASAPTTSGLSLNNILHEGPKLHNEIRDIILRFRQYKIAFTCDIKQMFRMISIHEDDQQFQLIYWRENSSLPLKIYQLTTVTFGMTSSPFLANRVIQELISSEEQTYPEATKILRQQIYVDDALLGTNSIQEALKLRDDVISLLRKGGFELRKWTSNNKSLLEGLPSDHCVTPILLDQNFVGILGLKWDPQSDVFSFSIETPTSSFTKRSVLSTIAKIYDITGLLAPLTFWAKALMQHIWSLGLDWDVPLSTELADRWSKFMSELPLIESLRIPRYICLDEAVDIQLHGFSDASELGYAACIYIRTEDAHGNISINLLIAKSRVAPLKRITIPRLELCGAHILANLIHYCVEQLSDQCKISSISAWCDSTIVLSWIHTPAYRLKLYVANRVSQIQELTPSCIWRHISSHDNPADVASRGLTASSLVNNDLWWFGPQWLKTPPSSWPVSRSCIPEENLPEFKPPTINLLATKKYENFDFIKKFSSWTSILHIMGYVLRFINCLRSKTKIDSTFTRQEIENSEKHICRIIQSESFPKEIELLQQNKTCSPRIQRLSPFLDEFGLIRVGGRLKNSNLPYAAKHQIILPKTHSAIQLLIDHYHKSYLHAGPLQLQAALQEKFWILNARSIIRSRVFKCLRCYRAKPKMPTPLMGDLPSGRLIPTRCFNTSAVDYAGPFSVKFFRLRRVQPMKVYICLFICLATKAVHLEVVTDLTTDAFIASLTRFISRRGLVSDLYSDNGTNFVGAASLQKKCFNDLMRNPETQKFAENHRVRFHFIPPRAPHQGGLWERAVRSAKHHLTRVIGEQVLTYEEFVTLTTKVEAVLNSRPITPLSADPNDLLPITPGHFLTGGPLTSLIEPYLMDSVTHLQRWRMIQALSQHFWTRWKREYLHMLQERSKWNKPQANLQVGDLVVIQEDNSPPLTWKMGRITAVSPGKDGVVRVVHLKTSNGTLTRPAVKVSRLPLEQ